MSGPTTPTVPTIPLERWQRGAVGALNDGTGARAFLALAMAGAAVMIWLETRGHTVFLDEWNFLLGRDGFSVDGLLAPTFGHLLLFPMIMYRGVWDVFGLDNYVPLRLLLIFFSLLCAGLLFAYLERRVGAWPAAAGATLLLFLGTGWEVNATTDGLAALISISGGLGMLLAFDRGDLKGDVAACLLLAFSLYSFGTGLPFLIGAILLVTLRPTERWSRAWVWAGPLLVYLVWRLWASAEFDDSSYFTIHNLANVPSTMVDSLGGSLAAVTGLFRTPGTIGGTGFRLDIGNVLAVGAIALGAWAWVRGARVGGRVWVALAMYAGFWVAVAMVLGEIRPTLDTAPRYFYPGVLFLLIAAAEIVARPPRLSGRAWTVAGVIFACAVVANAFQFHYAARYVAHVSGLVRAELGAVELARDRVGDDFLPEAAAADVIGPIGIPGVEASGYLAAADKFDSPAYTASEIAAGTDLERKAADVVLARALPVSLAPLPVVERAGPPPRLLSKSGGDAVPAGECLNLAPRGPGDSFVLAAPATGSLGISAPEAAPGPAASISAGAFSATEDVPLGAIAGGQSLVVEIPPATEAIPWRVRVTPGAPVLACAVARR